MNGYDIKILLSTTRILAINFATSLLIVHYLGSDLARSIASPSQISDEAQEAAGEPEESADDINMVGLKYLRIFTEMDEFKFAIFAEYGVNRKISIALTSDTEVELSLRIEIPEDALINFAGFHALKGPRMDELNEDFYFSAPEGRRFSALQPEEYKKPRYFPNEQFPLWVVFILGLEPPREELNVEAKVDFLANLEKLQKEINK